MHDTDGNKKLGHIRKHCPEELQTSKEALACANCGGEHRLRDCKEERVEKRGLDCRKLVTAPYNC